MGMGTDTHKHVLSEEKTQFRFHSKNTKKIQSETKSNFKTLKVAVKWKSHPLVSTTQ